jgi:hypothetical protein
MRERFGFIAGEGASVVKTVASPDTKETTMNTRQQEEATSEREQTEGQTSDQPRPLRGKETTKTT